MAQAGELRVWRMLLVSVKVQLLPLLILSRGWFDVNRSMR